MPTSCTKAAKSGQEEPIGYKNNNKMVTPLLHSAPKALKRSPLTAAERTAKLLAPRPLSAFNVPVNTGPLNVRRGTGINASI